MAGEWPDGFRLDPAAPFDTEMSRLGDAANADVVFRLAERNEAVLECATGCPEPATVTVTMKEPDTKAVVEKVDLCTAHTQAASNDRSNAKLGLEVKREFVDEKLLSKPEDVRRLESVVTSPNLEWETDRHREREPIARDTLGPGYGQEL
jgi:hypothetical protein